MSSDEDDYGIGRRVFGGGVDEVGGNGTGCGITCTVYGSGDSRGGSDATASCAGGDGGSIRYG